MRFTIDRLTVTVLPNRLETGRTAAVDVANCMRRILSRQDHIRMIFAAAPSQNEFLAELTLQSGMDWTRVTAYQMDEYIGLPGDHAATFRNYLYEHLFMFLTAGVFQTIDTMGNMQAQCRQYGDMVLEHPIDIVCLGIGENGHIAFNDPGIADFDDPLAMKVVDLDQECREQQVHDGCFRNLSEVPKKAYTLTMPTLLSGANLFCVVPGASKREAVRRTLYGPITNECPASILRSHSNCTLYLDADSMGDNANVG